MSGIQNGVNIEESPIGSDVQYDSRERKGVMGMFKRAFGGGIPEAATNRVAGIVDSEPVQVAGAAIIRKQADTFVSETLPQELRTAATESPDLGPSYTVIRESITQPEDTFFRRIFKSFMATALAAGVKISSLVGGTVLASYTHEDEEEKKKYPSYIQKVLMQLFNDRIKPNSAV